MENTIENFISFCDEMKIANEGNINIKDKINKIMELFRQFFIKIINKIKDWYMINFKHGKYIYKPYYESLKKYLDEGISEYREYIDNAKKELAKMREYIDLDDEYTNVKNSGDTKYSDAILKNTVYRSEMKPKYFMNNSKCYSYRTGNWVFSDLKETIEKLRQKDLSKEEKVSLNNSKKFNMSYFQLISKKDIKYWIDKINTFRKLGEEFDKFASSLNFPEHEYQVMPYYSEISKYATGFTNEITKAFMDAMIDPKDLKTK